MNKNSCGIYARYLWETFRDVVSLSGVKRIVVALPFRDILNSGSLFLAMSFGRCVVAPRLGSIPEVVNSEGLFGYDVENENGLADALAAALSSNDLLSRGAVSKSHAQGNYSWGDIGHKVKSFYELLLGT